jgi:hypothetical protein
MLDQVFRLQDLEAMVDRLDPQARTAQAVAGDAAHS